MLHSNQGFGYRDGNTMQHQGYVHLIDVYVCPVQRGITYANQFSKTTPSRDPVFNPL